MNEGLAILIARVDAHPEEFVADSGRLVTGGRWENLIKVALDPSRSGMFITEEERAALTAKLAQVRGDSFHREVLRKLLEDQAADDSGDQDRGVQTESVSDYAGALTGFA